MEIQYLREYETCGESFTGDLAVIEHWARGEEIAKGKPLGGFGSHAFSDSTREAEALLAEHHTSGSYEILLHIPVLIARLGCQEADLNRQHNV